MSALGHKWYTCTHDGCGLGSGHDGPHGALSTYMRRMHTSSGRIDVQRLRRQLGIEVARTQTYPICLTSADALDLLEAVEASQEFFDSLWGAWVEWDAMRLEDRDTLNALVEAAQKALDRCDFEVPLD